MKYFIYTRKSTDSEERQILSLEAQQAELKEFAAKEKLEIVAELSEAQTAKVPGRPVFGRMLERISAGEAGGILAWHPDRLARNSIDGGKIIYLLDTGHIKDLKFPTFWFDSTPQGKFMLNIAFGQSKYYIDNLSENVKRGHRAKLRKGLWPNLAPLGYVNNHKTKGIDIDVERGHIIRKAFELYATGEYTLKSIAQILDKAGLRSYKGNVLTASNVQRMLIRTIYYGVFKFNGEAYEGIHEPIITKKLFDCVQKVMNNRGKKKRKRKHEFAFSGFMKCGNCGCLITAESQKGHHYYRCTKKKQACDEKYLREENLIEQMKDIIKKVSLPQAWVDNMLNELNSEKLKAQQDSSLFVQNLYTQKAKIENTTEKLLDLYIEGNGIEIEEYQAKKLKLLNERHDILAKIRDFEQKGFNWLEPMKDMVLAAGQANNLLSRSDKSEIRTFLKNIGSNFTLKHKILDCSLKIGWRALAEGEQWSDNSKCSNWRKGWDLNP